MNKEKETLDQQERGREKRARQVMEVQLALVAFVKRVAGGEAGSATPAEYAALPEVARALLDWYDRGH